MCEGHSDATVVAPDWLQREGRATVALDHCIAETVSNLWESGIVTLGSCCGHGVERASLVLANAQLPEAARDALVAIDGRAWTLYQWQLVAVAGIAAGDAA